MQKVRWKSGLYYVLIIAWPQLRLQYCRYRETRICHLRLVILRRNCAKNWSIDFDDSGAIGRRYRRQDEIGTPYCITVDFESLEDNAVTIRERDSMEQVRISIDQVETWLAPRLLGC